MKKILSALKLTLPLEIVQKIDSIDGVWSFKHVCADPFVIDVDWVRQNEDSVGDDGGDEAREIARILDQLPECAGWRELDLLYLWPD